MYGVINFNTTTGSFKMPSVQGMYQTINNFTRALSIRLENNYLFNYQFITKSNENNLCNAFWAASTYHQTRAEIMAEQEIIRSAQRDTRNFAKIYNRYFESVFIYINRRVGDEEITADICSNVFFKCLNNLSKYRFQGLPFSAWLFKIALNEVNLYFRKEKNKERLVSLKHEHLEVLIEEIELDFNESELRKNILVKLLEALSADEVVLLELRFFEGRSFKEMAYMLGLTDVNAKIKTYRIIEKMKKHLYNLKGG